MAVVILVVQYILRYTLVAEYCDETGRRYAFISGWVWWVFGGCMLPFIGISWISFDNFLILTAFIYNCLDI